MSTPARTAPLTRQPSAVGAEDESLIEQSRGLLQLPLGSRDRMATWLLAGGFLVAAGAVLLANGAPPVHSPATAALLIAAYALTSRIDFEIATGSAVPTQLILVPMFMLLPIRIVPLCVTAGLLLGGLPEYARGRVALERSLLRLVNSWHALGPVVVLLAAGFTRPTLSNAPLLLSALAAQFLFDFASTAARDRVGLGVRPLSLLPVMRQIWLVDTALAPVGLLAALAAGAHPALVLLSLPLTVLLAYFARERRARIDNALELSRAYRGTALLLGDMVEADDSYTGLHSQDVVSLVLATCDQLRLDARDRRQAELTALLHDVGKVKIPNEIINKPGPLTTAERAIVNTHTIEGEQMLEKVGGLLGDVGLLVRSCHERWDGQGYPDGLAGPSIPLVARIVCACDAFSAMTTNRAYRKALSHEEAVAELRRSSGTQFDPDVVDALVTISTTARRLSGIS